MYSKTVHNVPSFEFRSTPMLRLTLNVQPLQLWLEALAARLAEPARLLAPAVPIVARAIERNFDAQGRPLSWPPLSPNYARWKQRLYPGRKILELTGRLRRSICTHTEGRAVVVSTNLPYAAAHQFGARLPDGQARLPARIVLPRHAKALRFWIGDRVVFARRARLPARPFLVLTPEDLEETTRALADTLENTGHEARDTPRRASVWTGHLL